MLNCTKCGHDNCPVTNAQIYGYYANSESLQLVEFCTECGDRIAEECKVCHRLHPLNSTHCALYGIKIEDFLSLKTDLNTRSEVFRNLPEVKKAMATASKFRFRFLVSLAALFAVLLYVFLMSINTKFAPFVLLGSLFIFAIIALGKIFRDMWTSNNMRSLWKKVNPGVLVPGEIEVYPNRVDISFVEWRSRYNCISLEHRLINLILNPVQ